MEARMRKFAICGVILGGLAAAMAADAKEAPLADCSGLPCASFDLGQGKMATLLIDTGNSHGLLDVETAKSPGLTLTPYVSRSGKTLLSSGALYFPTPDMHQPDGMFDGTVGSELFDKHRLTLDFHANKVWLD